MGDVYLFLNSSHTLFENLPHARYGVLSPQLQNETSICMDLSVKVLLVDFC